MDFIRSRINNAEVKLNGYYASFSHWIAAQNMQARLRIPKEILDDIFERSDHIIWLQDHATGFSRTLAPSTPPSNHVSGGPSTIPPANGSSPFNDSLPTEIRRAILRESLPDRYQTIHPTCGTQSGSAPSTPQRANRLADLMLINKKMRDEITETVYEERTFGVHVHQGFQNAGIEFLHVGRQPLQYLDHIGDARFTKFRTGDMFGFCRLKKVEVRIFPPEHGERHHLATNTYFMNLALVRLLQRDCENEVNRITSIRIIFVDPEPEIYVVGRHNIMATENPWWDTDRNRPRETSIHNLPDIQLVLRPFAQLSRCHSVEVQLPAKLSEHVPTWNFVVSLQRCMTGDASQNTLNSDGLDRKIEGARYALEDYVSKTLFGGSNAHVPKITDEELDDEQGHENISDNDEDDMPGNNNNDDGDDGDDDDDMDMDLPGGHGIRREAHNSKKPKTATASSTGFNEIGGFPENLDILDDDFQIAPNPASERVARFVECFGVTGDIARLYLGITGDDLSRASELFMGMSDPLDAEQVAAAQLEGYEGPAELTENQRGKLPDRREGSKKREHQSDPSTPTKEEQNWNKNNKGKGRAVVNDGDDQEMSRIHESIHGNDSLDMPARAARRLAASLNMFVDNSLQPGAFVPWQPSDLAGLPGPSRYDDSQEDMVEDEELYLMAEPPHDPETPTRRRGTRTQAQRVQDLQASYISAQHGMPPPPALGSTRNYFTGQSPTVRHDSLTSTHSGPDYFAPTRFPDFQRNQAPSTGVNQAPSTETGEDSGVEMPPYMDRERNRTQQNVHGSSSNLFTTDSRPRGRSRGSGRLRRFLRSTFVPAQQSHVQSQQQLTQQERNQQEQQRQDEILLARGLLAAQYTPFGHLTASHQSPQVPSSSVPVTATAQSTNRDLVTPDQSHSTSGGEAMDVDNLDSSSPPGGAPLDPEQSQDSGF